MEDRITQMVQQLLDMMAAELVIAKMGNITEEEYWLHGQKIYLKSKWEQQVLEERSI
jgi:hypothetical protein